MDKLREYRDQELRCRQRAMYDTTQAWKWLAEAEIWEQRGRQHRTFLEESAATSAPDLAEAKVA
jgi:hypothetical protein